jgi:hypothetical protein
VVTIRGRRQTGDGLAGLGWRGKREKMGFYWAARAGRGEREEPVRELGPGACWAAGRKVPPGPFILKLFFLFFCFQFFLFPFYFFSYFFPVFSF